MDALLIDLGWKSALIAGAALAAARLLNHRAAAERVLLLRVGVGALLALPVFALLLPALELPMLPAEPALAAADGIPAIDLVAPAPGAAPVGAPFDPVPLFYAAGALLVIARLAIGLWTLGAWTRGAMPVSEMRWREAVDRAATRMRRPVRLRVSPRVTAPMSWGLIPAWVLIDPALERRADQAEAVIAHEMAHVRRFDWPVLVASRIATAIFWFNPLVWLLGRELARQTELAADDEALRHVTRADYAQTLLAVAGPGGAHAACGMAASGGALAARIRRVLEEGAPRPASRVLGVLLLAVTPLAVVPLATARIVPAQAVPVATEAGQDSLATTGAAQRAPRGRPADTVQARAERYARVKQVPPVAKARVVRGPAPETAPEQEAPPVAVAAAIEASVRKPRAGTEEWGKALAEKLAAQAAERETRLALGSVSRPRQLQPATIPIGPPAPLRPAAPSAPRYEPAEAAPPENFDLAQAQKMLVALRQASEELGRKAEDRSLPDALRAAHAAAASTYYRKANRLEREIKSRTPR